MNPLDIAEKAGSVWAWAETKLMVALVCLVVLAITCAASYRVGVADEKASQAHAGIEAIAQAHADYVAAVAQGASAVELLQGTITGLRKLNADTQARYAHAPVVTSPASCPDAGSAHLTRAGVMQWNAALGYSELRGLPGRAADTSAGAAAVDAEAGADSGISLSEARDNAQGNFATCAEIRARCQTLIGLVKQRASTLEPHSLETQP